MKNIVVIPVYKTNPSEEELKSLRQCIRILGSHDICLICAESLDRTVYNQVFEEEGVTYRSEFFDADFFSSQRGYNRLMLNCSFYERFVQWDYMLIYQLDAYVFSDQLDEWCLKGYDYIGAPWGTLNGKIDWHNCGNGGFSLRKTTSFIQLFSHTGKILTLKGLWKFHRYRGPLHRIPLVMKGFFGIGNRLEDYTNGERVNEDLFYACLSHRTYQAFKIPETREAMYFAFEEHPSFLYAQTNQLPFGCHAYLKTEYETFYKPLFEKIEAEQKPDSQSFQTVSVVMCTYNGEKYIREQLDSIINQTYPIHELLIKDDCSTDGTVSILRDYQKQYPYIRLAVNDSHKGINDNFFSAMHMAEGDYIALSDQDDIWEIDKIENQMRAIGDNLLCSGFSKPFSSDGSPIYYDNRTPNYSLFRAIYIGTLPGHTLLLNKRLLSYLPAYSPLLYDMQLQIAAASMKSIAYVKKLLVNQRRYITATTYSRPVNRELTLKNICSKVKETMRYYREIKPLMQQRFCTVEDFLKQLPVKSKLLDEALLMAHLQTQNTWKSYWKLTFLCVKKRDYLFHVKDSNRIRAMLRAFYFPVFCSYYYRYMSKNFKR